MYSEPFNGVPEFPKGPGNTFYIVALSICAAVIGYMVINYW